MPDDGVIEEDFSEVNGTPFVEHYDWGLIGFRFYEGWMEDVRVCAAGLKARVVPEREAAGLPTGVNPAERLQKALISWHNDAHPAQPPQPRRSRWSSTSSQRVDTRRLIGRKTKW